MVGDVVEEANSTKSRWREWLLSSSPLGNLWRSGGKGGGPSTEGLRQVMGRGFGGNGRTVTVAAVERRRVVIARRAPAERNRVAR